MFDHQVLKELFVNKTAIITGGASGIGLAITKKFTSLNITCCILDIRKPTEEIDNITYIKTDVSSSEDAQSAYDEFTQRFSSPDILVSNAGISVHQRLSEGDPQDWAVVMETNVMGMLRLIRLFLPAMIQRRSGDIIFISSVSASHPYEWGGIYAASKSAVEVIAETLRLEVQPDIRVITIAAGVVDTPFFERIIDGGQTPESIGWGALNPEYLADAVVYAISQPKEVSVNKIILRPTGQPL